MLVVLTLFALVVVLGVGASIGVVQAVEVDVDELFSGKLFRVGFIATSANLFAAAVSADVVPSGLATWFDGSYRDRSLVSTFFHCPLK